MELRPLEVIHVELVTSEVVARRTRAADVIHGDAAVFDRNRCDVPCALRTPRNSPDRLTLLHREASDIAHSRVPHGEEDKPRLPNVIQGDTAFQASGGKHVVRFRINVNAVTLPVIRFDRIHNLCLLRITCREWSYLSVPDADCAIIRSSIDVRIPLRNNKGCDWQQTLVRGRR